MKKKLHYLGMILCVVMIGSTACSKKTNDPVVPLPPTEDTVLFKKMPFSIGASVAINHMKNTVKYNAVVTKEYNSITAENAMKFYAVHPSQNTYFWTDADYLVDYAKANNKRIHGHTLLWHMGNPDWVNNFAGDSAAWENLLKTHIQTVVTHFKGNVKSWDVVNEAFADDGTIRSTIWSQHLGNDYIARCFQYAHEADPDALLFYNDYGHEYSTAKRSAITDMINNFKSRGIPIHGTGLQFHILHTTPDANIIAAINNAAATGLKVHISELDIALNRTAKDPNFTLTAVLAEQQAIKYKSVVSAYKTLVPVTQQFGITTWNVGDADSWIPNFQGAPDAPLPFDKNYLRKPAYKAIIEGAK